jgi:hypothetical protein
LLMAKARSIEPSTAKLFLRPSETHMHWPLDR